MERSIERMGEREIHVVDGDDVTVLPVEADKSNLSMLVDRLYNLLSQVDDSYTVEGDWTFANPKVDHPDGKRFHLNYQCPECNVHFALYEEDVPFMCPACEMLGLDIDGEPK